MDLKLVSYLAYAIISVGLTAFVARSLFRNGAAFLVAVFDGDTELAKSLNRLLVVGFYLINLGFVSLVLKSDIAVSTGTGAVELLSRKLGLVLLVVGVMHLANLYVLNRTRRRAAAPSPRYAPQFYPAAPDAVIPHTAQ